MDYNKFIERKRHSSDNMGIEPTYMPNGLFPFQQYVAKHAIKKGRCAVFLDTGLGKTIIQLTTAMNYVRHTNKPVLIITPLAVAFQFVREAAKFDIGEVEYSKDGKYKSKIVITNYERLHYFNATDFDCVILDESSILKNFDGAIKNSVTAFLKKVQYRYLFTATPSPNDYIELGTSSEALGYLGYMDMLTKFFTNNEDTISPMSIGTEWVLKGHAKEVFFKWVSGWSISMRKPSDLGFSDEKHILPKLVINDHFVQNNNSLFINGQEALFPVAARRMSEVKEETKQTIKERCELAVSLANHHKTTVYWCNLNAEGDLIKSLDKNAHQIKGSMSLDEKEELLLSFFNGDIQKLITKPKMTAFGLNWQHCNHTVYFPTFSYEQWYQAIRRFWRFGQRNEVIADRVLSNGQIRVLQSIEAKTSKANELFDKLNQNINQKHEITKKQFTKTFTLPNFLQ